MYAVIHPDSPSFGDISSRHRTRDAAERAIETERGAFARSRHGKGGAWLDREVAECDRGDTRVRRQCEIRA